MEILKLNQIYLNFTGVPVNGGSRYGIVFYIVIMALCIYICYCQSLLALANFQNPEVMVDTMAKLIEYYMLVMRSMCMFYFREEIVHIFSVITESHRKIKSGPFMDKYLPWVRISEKIMQFFTIFFAILSILYGLIPLAMYLKNMIRCGCLEEGKFPLDGVWSLEGISIATFSIVYILMIFCFMAFCALLISMDITFSTMVLYAVANIEVVKAELEVINMEEDHDIISHLKPIVQKQSDIYDLIDKIQEVYRVSLLIKYCTLGSTSCLATVNLAMTGGDATNLRDTIYALVLILQLSTSTVFGSILQNEGEALANSIYCSNWYEATPNIRRIYLLMLLRAQQKMEISAYYMIPCTLETLRKTISLAASLYTLIRSIME